MEVKICRTKDYYPEKLKVNLDPLSEEEIDRMKKRFK